MGFYTQAEFKQQLYNQGWILKFILKMASFITLRQTENGNHNPTILIQFHVHGYTYTHTQRNVCMPMYTRGVDPHSWLSYL